MNVYKPRYKIAFQSKSKIWSYKDSRLRRFFNIRGRKLVRRGFFKRYVLVLNKMKWTIARRYIRPYMRHRKAVRRRFRNAFYVKQQMKAFHGKIKETAFRNIFKRYVNNGIVRKRSFYASLECRIDMIFFRMRLLPTIFAANHYILQYGVLLNRGIETSPNAIVSPGDIVSLRKIHWNVFYTYLRHRLLFRLYGKRTMLRRKFIRLKKKTWWVRKKLRLKKWFFWLKQKYFLFSLLIVHFIKKFSKFFEIFRKVLNKIILGNTKHNIYIELYIKRVFGLYKKFLNFLRIERKRRYLFKKFLKNVNVKKVNSNSRFKARKWRRKHFYLKLVKKNKQNKVSFLKFNRIYNLRKQSKELFYKKAIKMFSLFLRNYYSWLILKKEFKLEEMYLHYYIYSIYRSGNKQTLLKLKTLIKKRENMLDRHFLYIKKKLFLYSKLFFRKFIREKTLKVFYKKGTDKLAGNLLTYFFIRYKRRFKRVKKTPRLKNLHWAIPNYIYFEPNTMRAVLLYTPVSEQINYSFKASLPKIAAFYKSLAM